MDSKIFVNSTSMKRAIKAGDKKYIITCETYERLKLGAIDKNQAIRILGNIGINRNIVDLWVQNLKINKFELEG